MSVLYKKLISYFLVSIFFIVTTSTIVQASTANNALYIVSFNVLAPSWASPSYYSPAITPYLERTHRRKLIINFLNSVSEKADIIALQETSQSEFKYFKQALKHNFQAFQVYHDPHYWSGWTTPGLTWEPNGVALFIKKKKFSNVHFRDLPLTQDGNHSAYFEGLQLSTGKTIRAASIHLDSEYNYNRNLELEALIKMMTPKHSSRDIIIGDFNVGTHDKKIKTTLVKNHFVDTLNYLHREVWSSPFNEGGDSNAGITDHIVVRNTLPIDGHVINSGLWEIFPHDENKRIIANLEINGSDHFPLFTILK